MSWLWDETQLMNATCVKHHGAPQLSCGRQGIATWSLNLSSQGPEVSTDHPWTCSTFIAACLKNRKWLIIWGPRVGSFVFTSLTKASGRQRTSPQNGSGLHVGPSVSFRRQSPMTMTCPFFFMEAVLKANLTLVTPSSWMNHCPHYCSAPLAEPCAYCVREPGEMGIQGDVTAAPGKNLSPSSPTPSVTVFSQAERGQKMGYIISNLPYCTFYSILKAEFESAIYIDYTTTLRNPSMSQLTPLWV